MTEPEPQPAAQPPAQDSVTSRELPLSTATAEQIEAAQQQAAEAFLRGDE